MLHAPCLASAPGLYAACAATRKGLHWYPLFAHASKIPRNVWDLDFLVIFPYHVTSQMFTVESCCFNSAISYSLDKLGCSHLTWKDEQRLAMKAVYDGSNVFLDACANSGYQA